eukprot:6125684-Alexandrium_andersonii.AAC.1
MPPGAPRHGQHAPRADRDEDRSQGHALVLGLRLHGLALEPGRPRLAGRFRKPLHCDGGPHEVLRRWQLQVGQPALRHPCHAGAGCR